METYQESIFKNHLATWNFLMISSIWAAKQKSCLVFLKTCYMIEIFFVSTKQLLGVRGVCY